MDPLTQQSALPSAGTREDSRALMLPVNIDPLWCGETPLLNKGNGQKEAFPIAAARPNYNIFIEAILWYEAKNVINQKSSKISKK